MLQDRSGGDGVEYLTENAKRFIEAASKRPELDGRRHGVPRPTCRSSTPT